MLVLVIGDLHLPFRAHDLPAKFRKLLVPGKIQQIICTGNVCDKETYDYLRTVAGDVHVVRGDYDENPHFPTSLLLHHPPLRIGVLHGHQVVPAGDADALAGLARAMDADILLSGHTHRFEAFESGGRFFVNPGSATGAWSAVWPIRDAADEAAEAEKAEADAKKKEGAAKDEKSAEAPAAKAEASDADAKGSGSAKDAPAKEDTKATAAATGAAKAEEKKDAATPAAPPAEPKAAAGPVPSFALLDIQGAVVVTYVYQLIDGDVKVEKIEYRKRMDSTAAPANGTGTAYEAGIGVRY
ncbi:Metallo-dependent phosphatase [Tilletiopsis washingtonensis]|uniref:Vacuolar protein sorting-associated protein 29 n=1 Tax=Tilletiopsis washingtonensis TaxID=58919 RepID=A0A316ZEV9_9BASI|nr:Metallo-dependent phosphatase [Tilletiopsis washingtonensis]PWN98875.1 Metallo-dependent phosphatase [Tilletiopsis washingtonensis]